MKLILTVDDKNGLAFNGRRQSRDRELAADIAALVGEKTLTLRPMSAPLFRDADVVLSEREDVLSADGYVFAEAMDVTGADFDTLVLYRWNREYPSDVKFTADLSGFRLAGTREFAGSSHEKITREIYRK